MTPSFVDDSSSLDMRSVEGQICFTGSAVFSVLDDPGIKTEWGNLKSGYLFLHDLIGFPVSLRLAVIVLEACIPACLL